MMTNKDLNETTSNNINDKEFKNWCDDLQNSGLSDKEISLKIRDRVLQSPEMDKKSKDIFIATYDYIAKILDQGKPFEPNLLRIYLQDICGYQLNEYGIVATLLLCSMCGLSIHLPKQ